MDIIFFGSGGFALHSLQALVEAKHKVNLVVTQPDKPKGRHLRYCPTEVKLKAQELNLNIYQPKNPNTPDAIETLKQTPADLFVVISYGHILQDSLLELPKLYPLNIHASLLPKYRGAAPIPWAIINGESRTGISIIRMNALMDCGDILLQKKLDIREDDSAKTLEERLGALAAHALLEAINLINEQKPKFTKQNDRDASFAPKLQKGHGLIDWHKDAVNIANLIRALVPWPGAFTSYQGKLIKIWKAKIFEEGAGNPGEILKVNKKGFVVGCGKGAIEILELQLENGKCLTAQTFICGHKVIVGDTLLS